MKPAPTRPMLSFVFALIGSPETALLLAPAVRVAHLDHHAEDVVPRLLARHDFVREHAAVPADVTEGPGERAVLVPKPVTRVVDDIELAVGIVDRAVPPGLVVRPGPFHRGVVLRDMKIDSPGTQRL